MNIGTWFDDRLKEIKALWAKYRSYVIFASGFMACGLLTLLF